MLPGQSIIRNLQAAIELKKAVCCIHTLGFSADHDALFLSALTRAGSEEGTFHYIRSAADVAGTMQTMQELMVSSSFAPSLHLETGDGQQVAQISLRTATTPIAEPLSSKHGHKQLLTGRAHTKELPSGATTLVGKVWAACVNELIRRPDMYHPAFPFVNFLCPALINPLRRQERLCRPAVGLSLCKPAVLMPLGAKHDCFDIWKGAPCTMIANAIVLRCSGQQASSAAALWYLFGMMTVGE